VRHVLRSVAEGRLSIAQAAAELGISRSRLHALRADYRDTCKQGRARHWRPRCSGGNRRKDWPPEFCDTLRRLLRATPPASYSFAASEVLRRHAIKLHRATVRRFALDQHLAPDSGWKNKPAAIRRWQRQQIGSLWQLDATPHRWFPGQAKPTPLLNMLDDCSRLTVGVILYPAETLLAYLDFLPRAFLLHGLPLQIYVDYHSIFFTAVPEALTQLGAALRFYEMSFRYAPTPQAKGKIERAHQVWQQRLPSVLSAEDITDLTRANALLDQLRIHRNTREQHRELLMTPRAAWKLALKESRSLLRPAPNCPWWPYVWSVRTPARVGDDGRVSLGGQSLSLQKPRGTRLTRCQHPDGTWTLLEKPPAKNTRPNVLLHYQP
jgi:hypothetical protein